MKTIAIILFSYLFFSSQSGFADSTGTSDKCCPAPNDVSSHMYQQTVMDQIQVESESLVLHAATPVHVTLQKKMEERTDANRANLEQIQLESEALEIQPALSLTNMVNQQMEMRNTASR